MHIVIARYNEDLKWVESLPSNITYTIYNKGNNNLSLPSISIPNIGRESETYIKYIISNYHNLPNTICFCQGSPSPHHAGFNALIGVFDFIAQPKWRKKIFPLGLVVQDIINPNGGTVHGTPIKSLILDCMPEYSDIKMIEWSYGAQYIVDKEFILNKSLDWWKKLYDLHEKYEPEKYLHGSPWLFERAWLLIWNYETGKN